jgi:hypothetical protein
MGVNIGISAHLLIACVFGFVWNQVNTAIRIGLSVLLILCISIRLFSQLDLDFETDRGYYTNGFDLVLTVNDPTATIRYTTDGDKPTPTSGMVYTSPIPITSTSHIRAIAYASFDTTKVLTHTYIFPADVINQSDTKTGFPTSNFSFDSSITSHPTFGPMLDEALSNTPSISLVMNLNDFNDVHSLTTQLEYETSVEIILPNGEKGYQANGGIERAGGSSFNSTKRNFRLSFKSLYGDSKFEFPLFGKDAAESFDQISLRPGFHGCMHLGLESEIGGTNDLADQVMRNLQGEMAEDNVYLHGAFMHLYINGVYWGVYNPSERGTDSFAQSYYGGDKDNYDALKGDRNPNGAFTPIPNMLPIDGNAVAWDLLIDMAANLDLSVPGNYQQILNYVEPTQFADHSILSNFGPHADDNRNGKNAFVTRDRTGSDGFRFWIWDTEPSLGHYWTWTVSNFGSRPFSPIFTSMLENSDFKTLVGDRIQCHCFEDGALTVENAQNSYDEVFDSTKITFIAEAARWAVVEEYEAFVKKRDTIVNDYLPGRTSFLIDLYRTNGVYPSIDGVVYNQFGGSINQTFPVSLTNPNGAGTIYYTTNGTDPKTSSGGVSSSAQIYNGTFTLSPGVYTIKARVKSGSEWSAMCPTTFYVDQNYQNLVINEIHYNPNDFVNPPDTTSGKNFEFIEIKNCGAEDVNMRDMFFEKGIRLIIKKDLIIPPNGFAVFAEDEFWFEQKYGFLPDAQYAGKLDNGGENIWLVSPESAIVDSIDYNDKSPWPSTADKGYYSLALAECNFDNADPASWSIQSVFTTPGEENYFTNFGVHSFSGIVINEIHYNPKDSIIPGTMDTINGKKFEFIELKNISSIPINLSGSFLTIGVEYEFEEGVIIQPGDFIVLAEDKSSFEDRYGFPPFDKYDKQLDNGGETIWLVNKDGILLDAVTYDDVFPWNFNADGGNIDYSLALVDATVDNDTYLNWSIQCNVLYTPGAENDLGCFVGFDYSGLIINEIEYAPVAGESYEFIELFNKSFLPINLEGLRISSGVSFDFGESLFFPGQYFLIAKDSSLFENTYGVSVDGNFIGDLSIAGETIVISDLFGNTIDSVTYGVSGSWSAEPTMGIKSLALLDPSLDNNEGVNWCVQEMERTPKAANKFEDTDNDNIDDCIDSCPNFDNGLIGSICNDGDRCTTGETWDINCNCTGGVIQDSDNDGTCDADDLCNGIDDAFIGTPCDDGDPCTVDEFFDSNCQCSGGSPAPDDDFDGVCNFLDQCAGINDGLIGAPCYNGNPCIINEKYNSNCQCTGGFYADNDNDGICDGLDQCPGFDDNIDINNNGIPDNCEGCIDYITDTSNSFLYSDRSARIGITTNGRIFQGDLIYNAGQELNLVKGFEVKAGAVFHGYIAPCK